MTQMTTETKRSYYHVTRGDYRVGEPILSWDTYIERYGVEPAASPWDTEWDSENVCLFDDIYEAEDFRADFGGRILEINADAIDEDYGDRRNGEGYRYVSHQIPAEFVVA